MNKQELLQTIHEKANEIADRIKTCPIDRLVYINNSGEVVTMPRSGSWESGPITFAQFRQVPADKVTADLVVAEAEHEIKGLGGVYQSPVEKVIESTAEYFTGE